MRVVDVGRGQPATRRFAIGARCGTTRVPPPARRLQPSTLRMTLTLNCSGECSHHDGAACAGCPIDGAPIGSIHFTNPAGVRCLLLSASCPASRVHLHTPDPCRCDLPSCSRLVWLWDIWQFCTAGACKLGQAAEGGDRHKDRLQEGPKHHYQAKRPTLHHQRPGARRGAKLNPHHDGGNDGDRAADAGMRESNRP